MLWAAVGISGIFGVLRFVVPVSGKINRNDIYKDLAHIWVGILIGAAVYEPGFWWLAGGITALEVAAFLLRKSS